MSFETLFLTGVIVAFASLFAVMVYAWITVNLHERKRSKTVVQSIPARRMELWPPKQDI